MVRLELTVPFQDVAKTVVSLVASVSTASACAARDSQDPTARFVFALAIATARGHVLTESASVRLSSRAPIAASPRASTAAPTMVCAWTVPAGVSLDLVVSIAAQRHALGTAELEHGATTESVCATLGLLVTLTIHSAFLSTVL